MKQKKSWTTPIIRILNEAEAAETRKLLQAQLQVREDEEKRVELKPARCQVKNGPPADRDALPPPDVRLDL